MRSTPGTGQLVTLKDEKWFERQRVAGLAVAKCLAASKKMIDETTPNISLKDIEAECEKIIAEMDCTPTFKGYKGFPGAVCASVNKEVVHGIPSDYVLKQGDVVKIDLGATFEGAIGDAAMSTIYGEPKDEQHIRLLDVCQKALYAGIESIEVGKKMGCIGNAIYSHVHKGLFYSHFKLITQYGGHGIDYDTPHAMPFVSNKSNKDDGIRIRPGLTFAIEPMLAVGSSKTRVLDDGWTVVTPDIACHFEHTIFVGEDKVHIMTDWESLL